MLNFAKVLLVLSIVVVILVQCRIDKCLDSGGRYTNFGLGCELQEG